MDDTEAALPLALPHQDVISRLKAYQANSNDAEWLNCVFWWISLWVIWHQIVFHFSYCADFRACKQPRCPSLPIRNLALAPPPPPQSLSSLIVIRHSFEFFFPTGREMGWKPISVLCYRKIDHHCPISVWPTVNLLYSVYRAVLSVVSILLQW